MKSIQVRVAPEVYDLIKEFADNKSMSMSGYCEQAAFMEINRDILNPGFHVNLVDYYKGALRFAEYRSGKGVSNAQ